MERSKQSVQDLLALGAGPLLQRLDQATGDSDMNMAGVAQAAALRARKSLDVDWLRVANRAYSKLASHEPGRQGRLHERSAMTLRGYLLAKLGEVPEEPLLNLGEIVRWFGAGTSLSPREALSLADQAAKGNRDVMLQLRDIKNDLKAFELLEGNPLLDRHPEVIEWLRIRDSLT